MDNKFLIIVCFYNAAQYIEQCVGSILSQKYKNYRVLFVDDASTDGSLDLIPDMPNFIKIRNEENRGLLYNYVNYIEKNIIDEEEILVVLDGDDYLYSSSVLSYLNNYYSEHQCLVTYGQSMWSDGRIGFATEYTEEQFYNLRKSPFLASHLRTFKYKCFKEIKNQDPDYNCFKDENNQFYMMTGDVAVMFPVMEIAGYEKTKFIDKILYHYNIHNPISDHIKNQKLQTDIHIHINSKPQFKQIF